jgi:3-methyladenine DNA glycosylase AlkD
MSEILTRLRAELQQAADEETRLSGQRYFKEEVRLYGVKSAIVGAIGKSCFREIKGLSKAEIFQLCEALWQSGLMEESFVACNWSYTIHKSYEPADFAVFDRWVRKYVTNWASCDTLCNHTVGTFIEQYPEYLSQLKLWAASPNRWVRRAAAVTLIIPARRGRFLQDIFAIADILLLDRDDMVLKGYGWMLKAASEAHQTEVFRYVINHKDVMPRTALRYAIEKMPQELKLEAMAK